jgi:membrane-associated phospholipid phosphatase
MFTVWWLIDGGAGLDSMMLRFTGWLLHGSLDVVVSDSWPLGEPEVAVAVVAVVAALLMRRRRSRTAVLVVGGFLVLSAVQLIIVLVLADIRHVKLDLDALSHLYPSGHTARVPFLGTALAVIAPRSARGWILAVTALLAVALALDRTDSTIQTGSVVVGGLLLGIAISAWFAMLYSEWDGASASHTVEQV